jgi:hypothetical protein
MLRPFCRSLVVMVSGVNVKNIASQSQLMPLLIKIKHSWREKRVKVVNVQRKFRALEYRV